MNMNRSGFFLALREALLREEPRHTELSNKVWISVGSLSDLANREDEWYAVVPLYKLRFLCNIIEVDFDGFFSVPDFNSNFSAEWNQKLHGIPRGVVKDLYMSEEFWSFLRNDIDVLNLYPFQWGEDISKKIEFDFRVVLALLAAKS